TPTRSPTASPPASSSMPSTTWCRGRSPRPPPPRKAREGRPREPAARPRAGRGARRAARPHPRRAQVGGRRPPLPEGRAPRPRRVLEPLPGPASLSLSPAVDLGRGGQRVAGAGHRLELPGPREAACPHGGPCDRRVARPGTLGDRRAQRPVCVLAVRPPPGQHSRYLVSWPVRFHHAVVRAPGLAIPRVP